MESQNVFLAKWSVFSAVLLGLAWRALPIRADLNTQFSDHHFWIETLLWLATAISAAIAVYRNAMPGRPEGVAGGLAAGLSILVTGSLLLRGNYAGFSQEFQSELAFDRGICGPLIVAFAALEALALYVWIRKAAPTRLSATGAWIALSSASLGAFALQFICAHDSMPHLLIWHLLPVTVLALIGFSFGRRLLRW